MVGRPLYFWEGLFSGAMLVVGRVIDSFRCDCQRSGKHNTYSPGCWLLTSRNDHTYEFLSTEQEMRAVKKKNRNVTTYHEILVGWWWDPEEKNNLHVWAICLDSSSRFEVRVGGILLLLHYHGWVSFAELAIECPNILDSWLRIVYLSKLAGNHTWYVFYP